ncbi:hypothetical protein FHG87_004851 [Trinorchestia longiramus]|nr:hypothetical protein FHG87_004851 [Trinorchestia longiramus]
MKLENGQNLQDHLKVFVELFEELAIIGDAMEEEERVIILLSSLPDGFSTLATALEANEKIPAWEVVTERLLNEERRHRGGPGTSDSSEKLLSGTRVYRLYDFNAKKVLLSRDGVFNESQFMSFEKEPSKEIKCVPCSFPQEEKHEDSEGELELRRSTRNRAAPDRFGGCALAWMNQVAEWTLSGIEERPRGWKVALSLSHLLSLSLSMAGDEDQSVTACCPLSSAPQLECCDSQASPLSIRGAVFAPHSILTLTRYCPSLDTAPHLILPLTRYCPLLDTVPLLVLPLTRYCPPLDTAAN